MKLGESSKDSPIMMLIRSYEFAEKMNIDFMQYDLYQLAGYYIANFKEEALSRLNKDLHNNKISSLRGASVRSMLELLLV